MGKFKLILTSIITTILLIITIAVIYQNIKNDNKISEGKISDESINEENYINKDNIMENEIDVSSAEIRVSPNAHLIIKKQYSTCGHISEEKKKVPNDMVNKNQTEIEKLYPDYNLESFSSNEIILKKEVESQCDEHYVLREENDEIVIYKISNDGKEEIYQNTGISVEYLPETDKINLKNGIQIVGLENLNSTIEDFE